MSRNLFTSARELQRVCEVAYFSAQYRLIFQTVCYLPLCAIDHIFTYVKHCEYEVRKLVFCCKAVCGNAVISVCHFVHSGTKS